MHDLISRQALCEYALNQKDKSVTPNDIMRFPPAQPETSRIENALHGKSAEEQYDFIWWLIQDYGMQFTDSRQAAIEWLRGEQNER